MSGFRVRAVAATVGRRPGAHGVRVGELPCVGRARTPSIRSTGRLVGCCWTSTSCSPPSARCETAGSGAASTPRQRALAAFVDEPRSRPARRPDITIPSRALLTPCMVPRPMKVGDVTSVAPRGGWVVTGSARPEEEALQRRRCRRSGLPRRQRVDEDPEGEEPGAISGRPGAARMDRGSYSSRVIRCPDT